jgi:hypothetical protein
MTDGVYVDATWQRGAATVGMVQVSAGRVVAAEQRKISAPSSYEAEVRAVELGRVRFGPGVEIFCDCMGAAAATGATWVRRDYNQHAHLAAHGVKSFGTLEAAFPRSRKRTPELVRHRLARKRRIGRGVIPRPG